MRSKVKGILAPYGPSRGLTVKTYIKAVENLRRRGYEIEAKFENLLQGDQSSPPDVGGSFLERLEEADLILLLFPPLTRNFLSKFPP